MLLITKEHCKKEPNVIDLEDVEYLSDLRDLLNTPKEKTLKLSKITPNGLYAASLCKTVRDKINDNEALNCVFSSCTEPFPWGLRIAVSDIVFFRFKYGTDINQLIPDEFIEPDGSERSVNLDKYFDYYALAPVTKEDAKYIGAMLSAPRQAKMIIATIEVCKVLHDLNDSKGETHEKKSPKC